MKTRASILVIIASLLVFTSIASASPRPPKKFRIKGDTTYMGFNVLPFVFESEGKSIRNIHGTFFMSENITPTSQTTFTNTGTLSIETKKGDVWEFDFVGTGNTETVEGHFSVVSGPVGYDDMEGTYKGITDPCDLVFPCSPFPTDTCGPVFPEPDCEGFYVDFTFNGT